MISASHEATQQAILFDPPVSHDMEVTVHVSAARAARTMIQLCGVAIDFSRVERVPRYDETSRESDVEHSYMLALVAPEIAAQYYPELNTGLISQFAIIHDLIEIETGDVATFTLTEAGHAEKEAAEHAALDRLQKRLPRHTAQLVLRYEQQIEPEARFIRHLEKSLPVIVDILGPGRKVMEEDYGITTPEQLNEAEQSMAARLQRKFPEPSHDFIHVIREVLAEEFMIDFIGF